MTFDWLQLADCSIRHNTQVIIKALREWGKSQIVLGKAQQWNRVANSTKTFIFKFG